MNKDLLPILEAVLFAAGDPLSLSEIADILELDEIDTLNLLNELEESLQSANRGIILQNVSGGGYQLLTKAEFFPYVKKLAQVKEKKLSAPTMETLSIIAYKQPITKQEIENIRGVRIERSLAKLLEINLIEEKGRKDILGHPILYGTTDVFLRTFGLTSLDDLPNLPKAADVLPDAREEALKILNLDGEESSASEILDEIQNEIQNESEWKAEGENENINDDNEIENASADENEIKIENTEAIQNEVLRNINKE